MPRTAKNTQAADPSRHTKPRRPGRAKSRRVGPSATQAAALPRRRGVRNAKPRRVDREAPAGKAAVAPAHPPRGSGRSAARPRRVPAPAAPDAIREDGGEPGGRMGRNVPGGRDVRNLRPAATRGPRPRPQRTPR
jgi:hypothetical protein